MRQIILEKNNKLHKSLYEQLYEDLKKQIVTGELSAHEKCPSIRNFSDSLNVSVTTVMQAYNQLLAEGYIINKPGSGYYVSEGVLLENVNNDNIDYEYSDNSSLDDTKTYLYDEEEFDFIKWKKCSNKIFTDNSNSLLFESDIKGEFCLREEISKYLRRSRGVHANPENIIISAGTQQIAFHLGRILKANNVKIIALESPGYFPVKSIFEDAEFNTLDIPVLNSGIDIDLLPINVKTAVYVNPSNQFPTGVVMPARKRHEILEWALKNGCYVIEDDYNSELRYFGQPLPPIKSLDTDDRVIYLGSFSSTLFPAIKIAYMVLTDELTSKFNSLIGSSNREYTQTCSKAEQLTLAKFMEEGYYYTTIKKKRALYTKKLQASIQTFNKYGDNFISLTNTKSGLTLTLKVKVTDNREKLIDIAKELGIRAYYIEELSNKDYASISMYYSNIPLSIITDKIEDLCGRWKDILF